MYVDFLCFEAVELTTILNCSTNLQTVVFDYEEQSYCVDYTVLTFSKHSKLSVVPVALKICIQRDVFTQWDIHCYKQ